MAKKPIQKPETSEDAPIELTPSTLNLGMQNSFVAFCCSRPVMRVLLVISISSGVVVGLMLRGYRKWTKREIMYLRFPGQIVVNFIKCLSTPVSLTAVITSFAEMKVQVMRNMILAVLVYYGITMFIAASTALTMSIILQPGRHANVTILGNTGNIKPTLAIDWIFNILRSMFMSNAVEAFVQSNYLVLNEPTKEGNWSDMNLYDFEIRKFAGVVNVFGLMMISLFVGATLKQSDNIGRTALLIFSIIGEVLLKLTKCVIRTFPVAFFFLTLAKTIEFENIKKEHIEGCTWYLIVVLISVIIHGLIVVPFIYFMIIRRNPYHHLLNMFEALCLGFVTASSIDSIPVMLICMDEIGVDRRISRLLIPFGVLINRDGSAIHKIVSVLFIVQQHRRKLKPKDHIILLLSSVFLTGGTDTQSEIPMPETIAGLNSLGIYYKYIMFLKPVFVISDRIITVFNVASNAFCAALFAQMRLKNFAKPSKDKLQIDSREEKLRQMQLQQYKNVEIRV